MNTIYEAWYCAPDMNLLLGVFSTPYLARKATVKHKLYRRIEGRGIYGKNYERSEFSFIKSYKDFVDGDFYIVSEQEIDVMPDYSEEIEKYKDYETKDNN
jgi:hypothetical protein